MKKEITLFGQPTPLAFNLGAQIAYEDITGQAFELTQITTVKARTALYMACIIAADENTPITMDQLLAAENPEDIQTIDEAVAEMIRAWFHLPATAQKEEPEQKDKKHPKRSRAV